jgi:hypothetical protein
MSFSFPDLSDPLIRAIGQSEARNRVQSAGAGGIQNRPNSRRAYSAKAVPGKSVTS